MATEPRERFGITGEFPSGDEFRPGLPPKALVAVHPEWQERDYDGSLIRVLLRCEDRALAYRLKSADHHLWQRCLPDFGKHGMRPVGMSRSAVELLAAKALGEEDAREGREMRSVRQRARDLGYDISKSPFPGHLAIAYFRAYSAATSEATSSSVQSLHDATETELEAALSLENAKLTSALRQAQQRLGEIESLRGQLAQQKALTAGQQKRADKLSAQLAAKESELAQLRQSAQRSVAPAIERANEINAALIGVVAHSQAVRKDCPSVEGFSLLEMLETSRVIEEADKQCETKHSDGRISRRITMTVDDRLVAAIYACSQYDGEPLKNPNPIVRMGGKMLVCLDISKHLARIEDEEEDDG